MSKDPNKVRESGAPVGSRSNCGTRRNYRRPTVEKKRPIERVTLFSGGGVSAGGLTASG